MNVISASRRTDIPAFYSEWFMNRIRAGRVRWRNARSGREYVISLRPEDVGAIVFRSKNCIPLLPHLDELDARGFGTVFHLTITGLPKVFEPNVPDASQLVRCARTLSERYGPERVLWRCDPVLISGVTDASYYRARFRELALAMEGLTRRCYFCYPIYHKSVVRNTDKLRRAEGIKCREAPRDEQAEIASMLADIAAEHGIRMLSCCGDHLVAGKIGKAHCIDAELLHRLFPDRIGYLAEHPVREECGCAECVDIGACDTCMHGCVYCYANTSPESAIRNHGRHDPSWDILMRFDGGKGDDQPTSRTLDLPL